MYLEALALIGKRDGGTQQASYERSDRAVERERERERGGGASRMRDLYIGRSVFFCINVIFFFLCCALNCILLSRQVGRGVGGT